MFKKMLIFCLSMSCVLGSSSLNAMQCQEDPFEKLEKMNELPGKMATVGTVLIEKAQSSLMSVIVATGCMIFGSYAAYRGLHSILDKSYIPLKRFGLGFGLMSVGLTMICTSSFIGRKICTPKEPAK